MLMFYMGGGGQTRKFTIQLPRTDGTLRGFFFELLIFARIGKLSYITLCVKLNPLLKQALDLKASRQIFMRTGGLLSLLLSYPFSNYCSSPHLSLK